MNAARKPFPSPNAKRVATTKPAALALVPAPVAAPKTAYVAARSDDFDGSFDTRLFADLDALDAVTAIHRDIALPSLADARGYDDTMLYGLAEIAHHYLGSGGVRIGLVLFEGLVAVAPAVAYFRLGLAFALDRAGRIDDAMRAYQEAIRLDPADGRAEINLAELHLERGERAEARARLTSALAKSKKRGEHDLSAKASAILSRVR